MRVKEIVRRLVQGCRGQVHATRFEAVLQAVEAITLVRRVTLTSIGRAVRSKCSPRHGIKKVDRLLGNPRLHRERHRWTSAVLGYLVRGQRRVVVLVDWTQLHDDFWALVASIPFLGRSLPILSHCHRESELGSPAAHERFLLELRELFPRECRPVLVADGGFRSPFFQACASCSTDFVIRLRNERSVAELGGPVGTPAYERRSFAGLFTAATAKAQCLGEARPYASSPHVGNWRLVLGPNPPKAKLRRKYRDDYERKRACEPFLLATSLQNDAAETIVAIYGRRMQIEETFRDAKTSRFGWALQHSKTSDPRRLDVLLMLLAIAFIAVALVGAAAEELGLERRFRASSTARRVLSVFTLGNLVVGCLRRLGIHFHAIWRQLKRVRQLNRAIFPPITPPRSENRNVSLPLPHGLFCTDCGWKGPEYGWPP